MGFGRPDRVRLNQIGLEYTPELEERRVFDETDVPVPQLRHRDVLKLRFAAIHKGAKSAASLNVSKALVGASSPPGSSF